MAARQLPLGALGLAAILVLTPQPASAARDAALVRATVSSRSIRPGELVVVSIHIQGARGVQSVPFTLQYDPAVVELIPSSTQEGPFLSKGGAATQFMAVDGAGSRRGRITVGHSRLEARPGGGARGASGRGLLCRFTFRAISPGVSPLLLSRGWVLDPLAAPLPAQFDGTLVRVRGVP